MQNWQKIINLKNYFPPHIAGDIFVKQVRKKKVDDISFSKREGGTMDYEAQYDKIYRYCYYKVNNAAVAEDITQETFLRFLENSTYQENGKSLNYLYTIARNLCIDEYRKRVLEELPEDLFLESAEENIVEGLDMRRALLKLTPMERELILLRFVNEVPVKVICELQECSRFALNRKLKQVLKKLRGYLEEKGAGR